MSRQKKSRSHDKKIIVDMFSPFFYPVQGGVENSTLCLARELSKKKCEVRIHTFNCISEETVPKFLYFSHDLIPQEIVSSVQVFRYPFFYCPVIKFFCPLLLKAVCKSKARIVHIQGFSTIFNNFLVLTIGLLQGKKSLLTVHGLHEGLHRLERIPFGRLMKWIIVHLYMNRFHRIIALSNVDKNTLKNIKCRKERIVVISNGIDQGKFEKQEQFIEKSKIKKILCVARFASNKGYEDLIKALKIVKDRKDDFLAYFVGSISEQSYFKLLTNMIAEMGLGNNIRIYTSVSNSRLTDCYLKSDIFVLASRVETLPLVILEAMYAGLPIVATRVGGIPDMIIDGVNGYLVESGNSEQLADKLLKLLQDKDLCVKFGQFNKKMAQRLTWRKIANKTFKVYAELLAN